MSNSSSQVMLAKFSWKCKLISQKFFESWKLNISEILRYSFPFLLSLSWHLSDCGQFPSCIKFVFFSLYLMRKWAAVRKCNQNLQRLHQGLNREREGERDSLVLVAVKVSNRSNWMEGFNLVKWMSIEWNISIHIIIILIHIWISSHDFPLPHWQGERQIDVISCKDIR